MREPTSEGYWFGAFQLNRPERALLLYIGMAVAEARAPVHGAEPKKY